MTLIVTKANHFEGYIKTPSRDVACARWGSEKVPVFFNHVQDFWDLFDLGCSEEIFADVPKGEYLPEKYYTCPCGSYHHMDFPRWRLLMLERGSCLWLWKRGVRAPAVLTVVEPVSLDLNELAVEWEEVYFQRENDEVVGLISKRE